ncbi:hypothetical protein KJ713_01835 [Patescibacteria group bacterium]|nr:hypothetical protein [Patescibacteria group bacterium]
MKKKTQKIIKIIILVIFLLVPSFSLAQNPDIPEPDPDKRPDNCGDQCARVSSDGYYIHLWYKEKVARINKDNETFSYYAIAKAYTSGNYALYRYYIYKSTDSGSGFYIVVGLTELTNSELDVAKHYDVKEHGMDIASWDDNSQGDRVYTVIGPSVYPSGIKDSSRYSWKIGTSGSIQLTLDTGTILFVPDAEFQYYLDGENGPPLIKTGSKANNEGKFSVSTENAENEIWFNKERVNSFNIYTCFENNGQKYDVFKSIAFPGEFRPHSDSKQAETTKILENIEIKLDQTNKVDVCRRSMQGSLSPIQEITHGKNPWQIDVLNQVVCMLRDAFITVFYYEAKLSAWFLRRNY